MQHERQTLIPGWRQDRIQDSSALIVGCGALGSQLATTLARLGLQSMTLVDPDLLEPHNLENQAYTQHDLGQAKVHALQAKIHAIDPMIHVTPIRARIQDTSHPLRFDAVFGCLDNVSGRHYLNHLALTHDQLLIDAGIHGFWGTVKTIQPGRTACQSCHPTLDAPARRASCSQDPIPSTYITANVTANLQALQLVRILHDWPWKSHVAIDLARSTRHENHLPPNPDCEACQDLQ